MDSISYSTYNCIVPNASRIYAEGSQMFWSLQQIIIEGNQGTRKQNCDEDCDVLYLYSLTAFHWKGAIA